MLPERFHIGAAEILVGSDLDETVRIAAGQFVAMARNRVAASGDFCVALSGGSAPRPLFQALASEPFASLVPWKRVQFFWGDERNVAPGDPQSNYSMADQLLLTHVAVPAENVHRIPTGNGTAVEAANQYEQILREKLPAQRGWPRFDLILLGVGGNGHTASLFPHRSTLHENRRLVVADHIEEVGGWRVTLTLPVLNNAAQIIMLAAGEEKAAVVQRVLQGPRSPEETPAQMIAPAQGKLTWILDKAAARELRRHANDGKSNDVKRTRAS
jgi:6-phosphogluconolactonase